MTTYISDTNVSDTNVYKETRTNSIVNITCQYKIKVITIFHIVVIINNILLYMVDKLVIL